MVIYMVKIQINLSEEENKIVELHKTLKNFVTKEEAIKSIIKEFKPKIKF